MFGICGFSVAPFSSLAGQTYAVSISEAALASDTVSATLFRFWQIIDDVQTAGWAAISDAQSPAWVSIDTSSSDSWTPINTQ